jgi:outer membrane PBP1 activator LpoA protein
MRYLMVLIATVALAGCNGKPPAKTVLDPQLQALEKARAVEGKMQEAEQKRAQETESLAPQY